MITTTEPYYLEYLKGLTPISRGPTDDLLLDDDYHCVHLSRRTQADGANYDHAVTIVAKGEHGNPEWWPIKTYPALQGPFYCAPENDSSSSQPSAVASRIGEILTALGSLDYLGCNPMSADCRDFRVNLHNRLLAEGWRIKEKPKGAGWAVLPPMKGVPNDQ